MIHKEVIGKMGILKFMGHRLLGGTLVLMGLITFLMIFIAMIGQNMFLVFVFFILGIILALAGIYFLRTRHHH